MFTWILKVMIVCEKSQDFQKAWKQSIIHCVEDSLRQMQLKVSPADKGEAGLRWEELDSDLAATQLEILREITAKKEHI